MKQTAIAFFFRLLFPLVVTAILMSAWTTIPFASQLERQSATPKPTPGATGALGPRSGRLSS